LAILLYPGKRWIYEKFLFIPTGYPEFIIKIEQILCRHKIFIGKIGMIESPEVNKMPIFCIISKAARSLFDPLFFFKREIK
jgi:hypothetical protein